MPDTVPFGKQTLPEAIEEAAPTEASGKKAAKIVEKALEESPVLTNDTNQEKWWQSGVGLFGSGGALAAVGAIAFQVGTHGTDFGAYDWEKVGNAIVALVMFLGVLYRRFVPNLKPLFWRWTHPE